MSVPFALPAALAYGFADFAGGLAARRAPVVVVTALAQAVGLVALLPAIVLLPGTVSGAAVGYGVLAGAAGTAGLLLYFRGLALGPMGVVAPLSALVGAGLPLLVGVTGGERPGPVTWLALAIALAAIGFSTVGSRGDGAATRGVLLGLGAGVGFGLFFVALDATPAGSGLVPLVAGRVLSVAVLGAVVLAPLIRNRTGPGALPLGVIAASGLFDTVANVLFLLATRAGALSVSGVVVSLYPVVVVVLARFVLGERLTAVQLTGVGLALTSGALLAAS